MNRGSSRRLDEHFRAFSFVDRITGIQPGVNVRGQYLIPPTVDIFPASLVAEATGQLAAWAAMAAVNFTHRPLAGIAGRIELLSSVQPGQTLELEAQLEAVDTETVGYSGTAQADGVPVIRLLDCVGPMVPTDEFDNPEALRDRLKLLCAAGAPPGTFGGLPALELERGGGEPGQLVRAVLRLPANAPIFADHFPRRAVFPGTLLMHANLQTAGWLADELSSGNGPTWIPRIVSKVKLRTFIAPGEILSLQAKQMEQSDSSLSVSVESRINQRLVGSAEVEFCREAKI